MARIKKDGEIRTFKLSSDIIEKLDKISNETLLSKTAIVEKALIMYFNVLDNNIVDKNDEIGVL